MGFNVKNYCSIVEHKRQLVVELTEKNLSGSSHTSLPAIFLYDGSVEDIFEKFGGEMVADLDNLCDMFILGNLW